jgi:tetratricopeptide (TPR) repeat protein
MGESITIPDIQISRQHAHIWYEGGKYHIKDLESKNGTRVNNNTVLGKRVLNPGDIIRVGESELLFQIEPETGQIHVSTKSDETGTNLQKPVIDIPPKQSGELAPQKPPLVQGPRIAGVGEVQIQIARLYAQADTARAQRNWETAIASLAAILEMDSKQPKAQADLSYAQRKQRCTELYREAQDAKKRSDWQTALNQLQEILRIEPEKGVLQVIRNEINAVSQQMNIDRLYGEAQEAKARQDWSLALNRLQEIRQLDPKHPSAWREINEIQLNQRHERIASLSQEVEEAKSQDNLPLALIKLKAILEIDPGNYQARNTLTDLQRRQDQKNADQLLNDGDEALQQGNYVAAIQKYQAILKLQPDNAKLRYKLNQAMKQQQTVTLYAEAQAAMTQGNWKVAIDKFEALLRIDPALEDVHEALGYAQENLRLQNAELLYNQGLSHYQAGHYRQALDSFYRVKGLIDGYRDVEELIATIEVAMKSKNMPLPIQPAIGKPSAQPLPTRQPQTDPGGRVYELPGFDASSLADELQTYFTENGYETQRLEEGAVTMVQAKKTGIRSLVGMGLATNVMIEMIDNGARIAIGGGKWAEQGAAMVVGLYIPIFLVTGGVGMLQQKELMDTLWKKVESHIFSLGGRRVS